MSKIGTPVVDAKSSSKSLIRKNMEMAYRKDVTKPMATVPMIAIGTSRSGWMSSSAKCVAQSKQLKDQLGLIKPTMNAIPALDQPVPLLNSTKTNLALWNSPSALANTTIVMTMNDASEVYKAAELILGKGFSQMLANTNNTLRIWKVTKTCHVSTVLLGSPEPNTYMPTSADAMEMVTDTLVKTEPAQAKLPQKKPAIPAYLGGASLMAQ